MNVYEELTDLYNFDQVLEFNPTLHKAAHIIENELYNGHTFITPENKEVFVFRTAGTMGNHWSLYSITDNKYLIIGRRTKKQIIEEVGRLS
jgi:hypothetical protein